MAARKLIRLLVVLVLGLLAPVAFAQTAPNEWTWMGGSNTIPTCSNTGNCGASGVYGTLGSPAAGNNPGGRSSAASWTDKSGNFWLFGGAGQGSVGNAGYLNDLWEFSPSSNEWTWMGGSNTIPTCSNAGNCGASGVYGTLGVPAAGNIPGGRYGAAFWTDGTGNFWLFGGYGTDSSGNEGLLDDLWEFSPSTKEWTWHGGVSMIVPGVGEHGVYGTQGTPAAGNIPGGRYGASAWTDPTGNLWLYAGRGFDGDNNLAYLIDLWEFNPSTNEWTWMGGGETVSGTGGTAGVYGTLGTAAPGNNPGSREWASTWADASGNLWLFGGRGGGGATLTPMNDLWRFSPYSNEWTWISGSDQFQTGVYGTLGVAAATSMPGGRDAASSWTDFSGNLWLFGGAVNYTTGSENVAYDLNDVWEFDIYASEWIWWGGSSTVPTNEGVPAVYGTLGVPAAANTPGGRDSAANWVDSTGHFWLFGGEGADATGNLANLNDVWVFEAATPGYATPGVMVTPSPSSIATTQALTVTVTVFGGGGYLTPTGSVTLTSGSYTFAAATLIGGSVPINVPAGSLPAGIDTLTASYTPDSNSWATFNFASGSGTVLVTTPGEISPAVTVTPFSSSIATTQALSVTVAVSGGSGNPTPTGSVTLTSGSYTSAAATLNSGSATINVPGGSLPGATDTLTAGYTPDSASSALFNSATGTATVTVTGPASTPGPGEWIWVGGSSTAPSSHGNPGVYGTLGVSAAGNIPGSRSAAASWTDKSGNFWLFGGYGQDSAGNTGNLNDLWELNPSSNEWTWMGGSSTIASSPGNPGVYGTLGTPAAGNIPGGREYAATWTDKNGNLWLFGGGVTNGLVTTGYFNDLWEFSPSTNLWTWMGGSSTIASSPGNPGVYGTLGTPAAGNIPGGRSGASAWTDKNGNLWLFAGQGFDAGNNLVRLNDLWEFNPSTNEWTWMGGSSTIASSPGNPGVYGTLGTPAAGNNPGSREFASTWVDKSGNFWLFGGDGYDANDAGPHPLSDLWEFNPSTNQWAWMSGSDTSQTSVYGTLGVPGLGIVPGGRSGASSWIDSSGDLWLLGGSVLQPGGFTDFLDDLWVFDLSTFEWTWMGGTTTEPLNGEVPGVYGTLGVAAAANTPGGRNAASSWIDSSGHFWLFGGYGYDANGNSANLNDVWGYEFTAPDFTMTTLTPFQEVTQPGNSATWVITITSLNGFSGTIVPSTNASPEMGIQLPASITIPPGRSQNFNFVITSSLSMGTGTFPVTITGTTASGLENSLVVELEVANPPTPPGVSVTPSPTSITTAQALSVTVTVSGGSGNPTPTGSVTLTSGAYSSAAVTLSGGSATINIPAGSLATGTDTLTASYTPDSAGSLMYANAMGSNTVTVVTAGPTLTPQTINFTQPTSPVTYSSGLQIALSATGGASGNPVVFTIDGSSTGTGSISGSTLTVTTAGTFVIDANQNGNSSYSAAPQVQRTVVVTQGSQVAQLQFTPSQLSVIAGTGSGTVNGTGDGGSALSATFDSPAGVAQDSLGNVYVVDSGANYVRKFDVNGNITAFAGVPGYGGGSFSGDNGQATAAHLSNPIGIAIDSSNNVYIADYGNFRIRKVVPSTGIITTYAGTGNGFFTGANAPNTVIPGPNGIAFDPSGNLYIACTNAALILKVTPAGATTIVAGVLNSGGGGTAGYNGDNILANTAEVNFPSAVATDSVGNVYIADTSNNRIRKITVSTGMITTVAGNGTAGDTGDGAAATSAEIYASGIAVDLAGDLFIPSDSNGNAPGFDAVRKVDVNGNITTVVGGGAGSTGGEATAAQIGGIGYPTVDSNGDLIIPDYGYNLDTDEVMSSGPAGYLQFGNQSVGVASAAQTVTFENTGNATLTLSQTTYTATGAFTVTGGTCVGRTSLASGATCTLTVTFTPTSATTFTGAIAVNSNGAIAAQTITLVGTGVSISAPAVSLTPSPVAFGNQPVNTTSSPSKVVVLMNTGTAPLTGISISVTGTNASAFGLNSSACGTTLAAGASCNISLNFTPTSAVSYAASLSVADNATGSPQTVPLTGTGLVAATPTPSTLVFNPVSVGVSAGSAQTLTASFQVAGYTGSSFTPTAALHYGLSYSAGAVNCTGGSSPETCTVAVTFMPQYPGGRREALFLMNGTTRLATLLIYGIGQGPFAMVQPGVVTNPILSNPNYLYASIVDENGTVYILGDNSNTIYTVTKAGVVGTLPITGMNSPRALGINGAGVIYVADQTYNGPTITYDTVLGVQGTLAFPASSIYVGSLAVGDTGNVYENDYYGIYAVPLSGTPTYTAYNPVLNPAPTTIATDDQDNIFLGGSAMYEVAVGATAQTIISPTGSIEGLSVDAAGTVYASRYSFNSSDSVAELPLSNYSSPIAELDPSASPLGSSVGPDGTVYVGNYTNLDKVDRSQGLIAFGEQFQAFGTASPQQIVTIYNGGNETLTISNIAISGSPFSIQAATTGTNCSNGSTVAPGALCEIAVVVTPVHAGVFNGSITVTSNSLNASSTTQTIALTAYTYGVYVTPSPTSLTFPNQIVNTTSAAQTITLTNNGDLYTASFGTPVSGSSVYSIGLGTCTTGIAVGASCNLSITFTPTAAQSYNNVTVTLPYSSSGGGTAPSPVTFTLNGIGIPAAAPQAVLSPNPLAFTGTLVGTPASTLPMTLSNPGNAALTITSISVTGTNASSFGQSNNCGGSLAAGATCTITGAFTPGSTGSLTAAISVADNAAGSPQSAVVTGTGTQPQAVLSPNPLPFPSTLVGTAATALPMTLSNPGTTALTITSISVTGTNAGSFGQSNNCGSSLAVGANCTITVTFTPGSTGSLSAAISVADNATGSPQSAAVTGTGTAPQVAFTVSPLAFPSTVVGTSATALSTTLSNPGTAALTITGISVTGTNASSFGQSNNCGSSLAVGANCTITVTFTPGSTGSLGAAISVADNATGSPQTVALTGTGTQPQAVPSPNPLAFPSTLVGTAATALPMTLSNPGTAALTISSISVTGTNASSFAQSNNCGTSLAVGATCTITVTFTPASAASLTAAISVADNATGSPQSAAITGTGTPPLIPQAVLSPNPLAFPSTTINTSATPLPMTLSNPGNTILTITSISVTGTNASSFGETNNCGTSLASGATCTITVSFTPATAASLTAAISVTDNAAGSPQSATITGTGSAGTYTVNSATSSESVPPGAVAQYNILVQPIGGSYNNLVTLSATGLPAGAQVSFAPPAVTPGSAGETSVMSIQTSTGLARLATPESHRQNPVPLLALLAGLPLLGLAAGRRRLRRSSQRWMLLGLAALAILPTLALSGCGGGYFGPVPQTYTVTVVGTSGSLQETTTVSLIVQ